MAASIDSVKNISLTAEYMANASSQNDTELVAFSEQDPDNPKEWPTSKKWIVTGVISGSGFARILVSTILAPALQNIQSELKMNSMEAVMAMSVFLLATAIGPVLIGPLSELYGRRPVLHMTSAWFLVWNLVCGFAHNKSTLIAARFLAGFGASAVYALSAGVLGDLWRPDQRGRSLGFYLLIPLLAAAVGPILGGVIVEYTTWRWMFWSTTCFQTLFSLVAFFIFDETYPTVILRRKAERLRAECPEKLFTTTEERLNQGRSAVAVLQRTLSRPFRMLATHPIVQAEALLSSFQYGVTYLVLASYSQLWTSQYGQSVSASGFHYLSMCLGELAGAQVAGPVMDAIYRRLKRKTNGVDCPEHHIPLMIPSAVLTSIGLLLYGWAAQHRVYWLVVDMGAFLLSLAMQVGGQALYAYLIDSYPQYSSSASAAAQFPRSMTAFAFPLFAPSMYATLGYGWGNSLLALLACVIGLPAPLLLWKYGSRLRTKASSSH